MRTILHVDMNAYFASVEQAANPFLRGRPIAVGGGVGGKSTIVAAASYEAKARGVKTAMPAWEARKICPDLVVVGGDMNKYIYTSAMIMEKLREFSPLVEVFSIDEAFLDVTETKDRFGGEISIAKAIKRWLRENFHITCSIGIGPNKLLAKLAGELKKPDGLMRLEVKDIEVIKEIEVGKLCGVGRKLEKYLAEMGIKTIGDLHKTPREKLVKRFGAVCGEQLWLMGQGRDGSPVSPHHLREEAKSMGHSYTLPKNTTDIAEVKSYLLRLAEQVGRRLRQDRYKGNIVHVSLGFGNFRFWGKQKKVEDYIDDGYELYKAAEKLIGCGYEARMVNGLRYTAEKHNLNRYGHRVRNRNRTIGIRFVGVSLSGLIHNLDQVSLIPQKEASKKVLQAVDEINNRYGEFTVERAATMKTVLEKKAGLAPRPSAHT